LLLGEAYARRDHVALVAFRGDGADILLPPTRSLVQTKRRLGQLPGGGGTPLASGLKAALELAHSLRARG
jgi:magnesium chelatase subunit D